MTTYSLPRHDHNWTAELFWAWITVPLMGALRYGPAALLAIAAAFASAQFAQHYTIFPWPLAWLIGIAFEWLYLGSLAMSAALRNSRYFKPVNLGGMIVSIIYGTLYAADKYGALQGILELRGALWIFAVIHAAPLAGMNFLYNSLIHEYHAEQRQEADSERHYCVTCKRGWPSMAGWNGHKKGCSEAVYQDRG